MPWYVTMIPLLMVLTLRGMKDFFRDLVRTANPRCPAPVLVLERAEISF